MFGSFTWLNILLGFGFGAVIVSRSFRSQLSDLKLTVEIVLILNWFFYWEIWTIWSHINGRDRKLRVTESFVYCNRSWFCTKLTQIDLIFQYVVAFGICDMSCNVIYYSIVIVVVDQLSIGFLLTSTQISNWDSNRDT